MHPAKKPDIYLPGLHVLLTQIVSQMSSVTYLRLQMKIRGWIEAALKPHPECDTFNKAEFPGKDAIWQPVISMVGSSKMYSKNWKTDCFIKGILSYVWHCKQIILLLQ